MGICDHLSNIQITIFAKDYVIGDFCRPKEKSSNWHFFDFHFFAKNYNLVNALSCVLVIFLEKKLNAWKRVFSVLQKAVSAFVPTKFFMFPQGKKQYLHPQGKKQYLQR